jgi:hypothetical protein
VVRHRRKTQENTQEFTSQLWTCDVPFRTFAGRHQVDDRHHRSAAATPDAGHEPHRLEGAQPAVCGLPRYARDAAQVEAHDARPRQTGEVPELDPNV